MQWIVRLRYGVIAGEAAVAALVSLGLRVSLPLAIVIPLAIQLITNILLSRRTGEARKGEHLAGALFCLDTVCLTLILAMTGGPANPFSLLYLVQITFSAAILRRAWTWTLGILSVLSFALLFRFSSHIPALHIPVQSGEFPVHLFGMWLAFATAALLISFFVAKVSEEARQKERELLAMQQQLARNERLASLVTLAAGAAHEIATPLSTIAVTAKEMANDAARRLGDKRVEEDAMLIRSQVDRCRVILERMGAQGADPFGEAPRIADFNSIFARVVERFPEDRRRIRTGAAAGLPPSVLPENAAVEAIAALVKNALDASVEDQPVLLTASSDGQSIRVSVKDRGTGMTAEVMNRVLEPFFTTKPAGKGMGLGAFLAHLFAQRLGGQLSFESKPGEGCTATIDLPVTNE
jgi:two-component system sensor histidine kinase RegB